MNDSLTMWPGTTVGVTGAGGFIGSHLVEALLTEGAHVRAFVHYNSRGDRGFLRDREDDNLVVIAGDLRDSETVRNFVHGCGVIYHLGALIGIPYSYSNPRDVVDTNILGTLNVLQAARAEQVSRVVHTSTSEVYGTAQYTPIDERHPLQGQSPYAASKIGADKLAESFYLSFRLPVVTIRPFNTYGPRQSSRAVIPTIIAQALRSRVVRLGSLEPRRDFNFVADTVGGFLLAGQTPSIEGATINLGSGVAYRIGDVARTILDIIDSSIEIVGDEQRLRPPSSEVLWLEADARKAQALLGWSSQVDLVAGITRTVAWMRTNPQIVEPSRYGV